MKIERRFGENLSRIRKAKGLSQEELSFTASLHRTEIGMLERGIRLARIDTLLKLAGALDVTPGELLDGIEWAPGETVSGSFDVQRHDDSEMPPELPRGRRAA